MVLELPPSPQLFLVPADLQRQQADPTLDGCGLRQRAHARQVSNLSANAAPASFKSEKARPLTALSWLLYWLHLTDA